MKNFFVIDQQLPSLNEYVNKCRTHSIKGAQFKEEVEQQIWLYILRALSTKTLKRVNNYPVEINIEWHEKDYKRDVDNIKSAAKFILDTMVKTKIIKDDGRKYVSQVYDLVVDDTKTKVVVEILEKENP